MMTLEIILPTLGIIVGVFGLIFALTLSRATKAISRMHKLPTCSASACPSTSNQGIYIEHGMAKDRVKNKLKAQHKLSRSFFDSLV